MHSPDAAPFCDDPVMDAFIAGIAVAALAGATALAFKRPKIYRRLVPWIIVIVFIIILWPVYSWDMALNSVMTAVIPYIEAGKYPEAVKTINGLKLIGSPYLFVLCALGAAAWLCFLYFLPDLNLLPTKKPDHDSQN